MWRSIRNNLGPVFLILTCPPFVMLMWYANTALDGSLWNLVQLIEAKGLLQTIYFVWQPVFFGSAVAWKILACFALCQLLLIHILPGKPFKGPISPKGNVPIYKANGVPAFFTSIILFVLATCVFHLFNASVVYDHLGELLGALNLFSLGFCVLLYLKGRFFPSSNDTQTTGQVVFDYYWGLELYPTILGTPVKMFIACRLGMMSWGLILLSYAAKQQELSGLSNAMVVSVALQLIYITKFYIWETGYLCSLDMMHDRAGFYICWGCLVWLPCIYTSPSMYLVLHPVQLSPLLATAIFMLGVCCIMTNYLADRQRQLVRKTSGNCEIWNRKPKLTVAQYQTAQGEMKENILLASGFWGISRHFHYLPEIGAAFCWSVPALFTHFSPYFYVSFLTILLIDRAFRDDQRCAKKYGKYWDLYCQQVPYKILPFVI